MFMIDVLYVLINYMLTSMCGLIAYLNRFYENMRFDVLCISSV